MGGALSWRSLGATLLGVMAAKWAWALLEPASPGLPAAAWEGSADAAGLFGAAPVEMAPVASVGNVKLIGVFAHRTRGFAVMQVDDKQIGVAQGEDVKPGLRLVETFADHVMLEQGGVRKRVDLAGASAPAGATAAPSGPGPGPGPAMSPAMVPAMAPPGQAAQIDALQQQLTTATNLPPERREMLQRQLDKMRGQH